MEHVYTGNYSFDQDYIIKLKQYKDQKKQNLKNYFRKHYLDERNEAIQNENVVYPPHQRPMLKRHREKLDRLSADLMLGSDQSNAIYMIVDNSGYPKNKIWSKETEATASDQVAYIYYIYNNFPKLYEIICPLNGKYCPGHIPSASDNKEKSYDNIMYNLPLKMKMSKTNLYDSSNYFFTLFCISVFIFAVLLIALLVLMQMNFKLISFFKRQKIA